MSESVIPNPTAFADAAPDPDEQGDRMDDDAYAEFLYWERVDRIFEYTPTDLTGAP